MSKPTDLTTVAKDRTSSSLPHTQSPHDLTRRDTPSNETMMETIVEGEHVLPILSSPYYPLTSLAAPPPQPIATCAMQPTPRAFAQ